MEKRIGYLREQLRLGIDIPNTWQYFHQQLVRDPKFVEQSVPKRYRSLENALRLISEQRLQCCCKKLSTNLACHETYSLWHGTVSQDSYVGICVFDEVEATGLFGISTYSKLSQVRLTRFSIVPTQKAIVSHERSPMGAC
jgi:hypothetical protein